jgi:hypothetical protein
MLHHGALVSTDVLEKCVTSICRVIRIGEARNVSCNWQLKHAAKNYYLISLWFFPSGDLFMNVAMWEHFTFD